MTNSNRLPEPQMLAAPLQRASVVLFGALALALLWLTAGSAERAYGQDATATDTPTATATTAATATPATAAADPGSGTATATSGPSETPAPAGTADRGPPVPTASVQWRRHR